MILLIKRNVRPAGGEVKDARRVRKREECGVGVRVGAVLVTVDRGRTTDDLTILRTDS
jgi:hypothetical protein